MAMDNSSPSLNQRGLKWFFRTSPHDEMFTAAMFDFFKAMGDKTGHPVKSVSRCSTRTASSAPTAPTCSASSPPAAGITVAADIKYRANSPSLSAEAQKLKAANADVVMPSSYTSDAILLMRSHQRDRLPPP